MEISEKYLNKDMVLIYMMCKELSLDFKAIKALYIYHGNIFWNFIYFLFPAFKMSIKKMVSLDKVAEIVLAKLRSCDEVSMNSEDLKYYNSIQYYIKDKYENDGELYTLKDVLEYLYFKNVEATIIFEDNKYVKNTNADVISSYSKSAKQINVYNKVFRKTSIYGFRLAKELEKGLDLKQATKNTLTSIKKDLNESDRKPDKEDFNSINTEL